MWLELLFELLGLAQIRSAPPSLLMDCDTGVDSPALRYLPEALPAPLQKLGRARI
jgi:hypothetical protein